MLTLERPTTETFRTKTLDARLLITSLENIVAGVLDAGFHVFAIDPDQTPLSRSGFVFICKDLSGSFAVLNRGYNYEPCQLSASISPSRQYGSSVLVDHEDNVESILCALNAVCDSPTVTVRFMGNSAPVVPNYGRNVLDKWPARDRFIEIVQG